jgi:hypothetical protein
VARSLQRTLLRRVNGQAESWKGGFFLARADQGPASQVFQFP